MDTSTIREILLKNIGPLPKAKRKRRTKWMPVRGYEGCYEVSKTGKVRSKVFTRYGKCKTKVKNKILKPYLERGNTVVNLKGRYGKTKKAPLKKLVSEHWFHPVTPCRKIRLKDGNPFNCAVSNMTTKKGRRPKKHDKTNISS